MQENDFSDTTDNTKQTGFRYTPEQTGQECEVHETSAYKTDESLKNIDDYYALPDDERVELIDGRFYAMSTPTVNHQDWVLELAVVLKEFIDKHFNFGKQPKTVISREYSSEWKKGDEPYYPVNDERNEALYKKYQALAAKEDKILFGGRLGQYKYYDMDKVIAAALDMCQKLGL